MRTVTEPTATRPHRGVLQLLKAYFSHNRIGDLLVLQGHLDSSHLEHALTLAKARGHRLGQVLLDEGLVRRHHLYTTLGTQWSVRTLAYASAAVVSLASFMPRQARADDGRAQYAATQVLAYNAAHRFAIPDQGPAHSIQKLTSYPALFGSAEKQSRDLSAFTKWADMFERYDRQYGQNDVRAQLVSWDAQVKSQKGHSLSELARSVDALMNSIPYVDDKDNYGKNDYWATPYEFLTQGGDCEDYAIAKYMALKSLGVSEDRMRIAIVHDLVKKIPHAILIVYTEEGAMVLDNQSKTTRKADEITRYKPIFSINQTAWWLHTAEPANIQVASAAR
jgi:predicted transglutaminase-like cysteine proteinase